MSDSEQKEHPTEKENEKSKKAIYLELLDTSSSEEDDSETSSYSTDISTTEDESSDTDGFLSSSPKNLNLSDSHPPLPTPLHFSTTQHHIPALGSKYGHHYQYQHQHAKTRSLSLNTNSHVPLSHASSTPNLVLGSISPRTHDLSSTSAPHFIDTSTTPEPNSKLSKTQKRSKSKRKSFFSGRGSGQTHFKRKKSKKSKKKRSSPESSFLPSISPLDSVPMRRRSSLDRTEPPSSLSSRLGRRNSLTKHQPLNLGTPHTLRRENTAPSLGITRLSLKTLGPYRNPVVAHGQLSPRGKYSTSAGSSSGAGDISPRFSPRTVAPFPHYPLEWNIEALELVENPFLDSPNEKRIYDCLLLSASADAISFHNSFWSEQPNPSAIMSALVSTYGSLGNMDVAKLTVSDDTVLHFQTIYSLLKYMKLHVSAPHLKQSKLVPWPFFLYLTYQINFPMMKLRAPDTVLCRSMELLDNHFRRLISSQSDTDDDFSLSIDIVEPIDNPTLKVDDVSLQSSPAPLVMLPRIKENCDIPEIITPHVPELPDSTLLSIYNVIEFTPNSWGSSSTTRSMGIGLIFSQFSQIQSLIEYSVDAARFTHNNTFSILSSFASALFTSFAFRKIPLVFWPIRLLAYLPLVALYLGKLYKQQKNPSVLLPHGPASNLSFYFQIPSTMTRFRDFAKVWEQYIDIKGLPTSIENAFEKFPKEYQNLQSLLEIESHHGSGIHEIAVSYVFPPLSPRSPRVLAKRKGRVLPTSASASGISPTSSSKPTSSNSFLPPTPPKGSFDENYSVGNPTVSPRRRRRGSMPSSSSSKQGYRVLFPSHFGLQERNEFYKTLCFHASHGISCPAGSALDTLMIAYDSLLWCQGEWKKLIFSSGIHSGHGEASAFLAGGWYGLVFGSSPKNIPSSNIESLEFKKLLGKLSKCIFNHCISNNG